MTDSSLCSEFASKMESRAGGNVHKAKAQSANTLNRSLSNSDVGSYEKNDGSISDSAISLSVTEGRRRRPSLGYKVKAIVGLARKSNSTSQLTGGAGRGTVFLFLLHVISPYCLRCLFPLQNSVYT